MPEVAAFVTATVAIRHPWLEFRQISLNFYFSCHAVSALDIEAISSEDIDDGPRSTPRP
jgi:hypothetical protein